MSTFADNFDRADASPISAGPGGVAYDSSNMDIVGNYAVPSADWGYASPQFETEDDCSVLVALTTATPGGKVRRIYARNDGADNYLYVEYTRDTDTVRAIEVIAGVPNTLISHTAFNLYGAWLKLWVVSGVVHMGIAGSEVGTPAAHNVALPSGGRVIFQGESGAQFDLLEVEGVVDPYEPPDVIEVLDTAEIVGDPDGGDFPEFDATHVKGILVHVTSYSGASAPVVEDSAANANWEQLTARTSGEVRDVWWWNPNPSTAADLVVSVTGSGIYASAQIIYLDGPRALVKIAEGGATGTLQPGPITPARDGCLVAAGGSGNNGFDDTISVDAGFTLAAAEEYENGVNEGGAAAYLIQTTAAAADPTFSVGGSPGATASSLVVIGLAPIPDGPASLGVGAAPASIVLRLSAASMGVGAGRVTMALANAPAAHGVDAEFDAMEFSWSLPAAALGVGAPAPHVVLAAGVAGAGLGAAAPRVARALGPAGIGLVAAGPGGIAVRLGVASVGIDASDPDISGIETPFLGHSGVVERQSIDVSERL